MAKEGAMSTPTVKGILSLLLLAWPSAGKCRRCALILPVGCGGGEWGTAAAWGPVGSWVHLFSALLGAQGDRRAAAPAPPRLPAGKLLLL